MEITLNLTKLKANNLSPDQAVFLYLLYYKDIENIKKLFSLFRATQLKHSLIDTKYMVTSSSSSRISELDISTKHVANLFGIREDKISFVEFYNIYPIRVGTRVLRAANLDTVIGRKHKKKYLKKVTSKEQHDLAVKATQSFVDKQRMAGKLQYLPAMETVLNNALWETWESLIEEKNKEGTSWNEESI